MICNKERDNNSISFYFLLHGIIFYTHTFGAKNTTQHKVKNQIIHNLPSVGEGEGYFVGSEVVGLSLGVFVGEGEG